MINKIKIAIALSFILPALSGATPSKLTDINLSQGGDGARLNLILSEPTQFHVFALENPNRLVVDLHDARLATNLQKVSLSHSALKSLRGGHPNPETLRLVFDLKNAVHFKSFANDNKIMLDIYAENSVRPTSAPTESPTIVEKKSSLPFVVVIDPGHGGKDPGAVGELGTQEKNVVLAISKRLAQLINNQPNMRAVLTRNGDYFVPLRERLKLARKGKADLFIAIHADSYFNNRSTGASVYALSHRGATSEAARWLAKRDNYSELGGVDLGELGDKSYVLRSVLIDLAQTATITDSLRLGNAMLDSLDKITELHYTRVEQAPFVVLKSPDIPSILVETGFISNRTEEVKLRDERYQTQLAQALFSGVQQYIRKFSATRL